MGRNVPAPPPVASDQGRAAGLAANEELQKSEFRYRNMFQAMAVSFWELDFSGVGGLLRAWKKAGASDLRQYLGTHRDLVREAMEATRVLDVNEKTVHLFRARDREALLGSVAPYWPPQSENVYAESVIAAVSGAPCFEAEAEFRAADGHLFEALFTVSFPKGAVGRGTILVGIIDMTERNHAQASLAKVQAELAHATRVATLGELTASIAHEVNQPLAAIVTNGEAGLRWLNRETPDLAEVQKVLGRMIDDGKRAAQVLSRIRGMATKAPPRRAPMCLNEAVGHAVALTRREAARNDIALRVELAPHLPKIDADKVQIQQVLVNLLVNGVQAMSQTDSPRALSVRTTFAGGSVVVEVEDSGPGISPDDTNRVFQAFFTTKASGMGMGLSICKAIVDAHGGRIWSAPKEGPGALFQLSLPAIPAGSS